MNRPPSTSGAEAGEGPGQGTDASGGPATLDELLPGAYAELLRLAEAYLSRERPDHTLQATALVHEAYLRLVDQRSVDWRNRVHFFGAAAEMMRRILVNHARARRTAKRGGDMPRLALDEAVGFYDERNLDIVALDDALTELALIDGRQGRVVELRFFAGLSIEETADVLSISPATVKREWHMARAWLRRELREP